MRRSWPSFLLAAVVAQIPFEAKFELFGLTNLQWSFVALVIASVPVLLRNWKVILQRRAVQAAVAFVAIQWATAFLAPEYQANAIKAAVRFSAGLVLFLIAIVNEDSGWLQYTWAAASAGAATYALVAYAGIGVPWLFRNEEFYIGQVQRLSGSFEYPNTAAAYFAMSLPIVWWSGLRQWMKRSIGFLLACALILTFSKGALAAIFLSIGAGLALSSRRSSEWRSAVTFLAIVIVAYAALLPVNPYLLERLYGPAMHNPLSAEYRSAWNHLCQQPDTIDEIPLAVRNTGISTWRADGIWRSAIGYRWWNIESETFVPARSVSTPLPRNVGRGEMGEVVAHFKTPPVPGKYLLVLELFSRDFDWFSQTGVIPLLVQVDIQQGSERLADLIDMSKYYHRRQVPGVFTASVPRTTLWQAAVKIVREHPLGIGPDNFRLEYGKYIGARRWDTHVYTNDLFLEILAGSGVLGLAVFLAFVWSLPWRFGGASLGIAIFIAHGVVDVFIMATPIYFAFWFLAGTLVAYSRKDPGVDFPDPLR